jgi:type I site-specific restriction endonuclease
MWDFKYERAKKRAKRFYKKIGRVVSPALGGEEIIFSSVGFDHLLRKKRDWRPKRDQMRRFGLLKHLKKVVGDPHVSISYREKERTIQIEKYGRIVSKRSIIRYWTFVGKIEKEKIRVIVSQIGNGKKQFLSVMN